jgi:hypothetical protein
VKSDKFEIARFLISKPKSEISNPIANGVGTETLDKPTPNTDGN